MLSKIPESHCGESFTSLLNIFPARAGGQAIFFVSQKTLNVQIAIPQFDEKSSVPDPNPHWFASNSFYLRRYMLDYEMPCNSLSEKLFQKPKVILKYE